MKKILLAGLLFLSMTSFAIAQDHHPVHHPVHHKPVHHHHHPVHHPAHHRDHR